VAGSRSQGRHAVVRRPPEGRARSSGPATMSRKTRTGAPHRPSIGSNAQMASPRCCASRSTCAHKPTATLYIEGRRGSCLVPQATCATLAAALAW
jgi:hypothetical protein